MPEPQAPATANIPDPALTILEAALERERQISRDATSQLQHLQTRESQISQQHPRVDMPPLPPPLVGSGWTIDTLMAHLLALREGDRRFYEERDRRYAEVNVEKEKALKIKETADLAALQLAREIQTYKDEKANELREQISSERGHYASKEDLVVVSEKSDDRLAVLNRDISEIRQALARGPEGLGILQGVVERSSGSAEGERHAKADSYSKSNRINGTLMVVVGVIGLPLTLALVAVAVVAASGGFK